MNEINGFKNGVEKPEKINTQLKDTKIKMDLTKYKSIIETHQRQMTSYLNSLKSFENRFDSKIKQAKIYPTWAVVVFIISLMLGFVSVSYVFLK